MSTEMHDLNERLVDEEEGYLEVGEDGEKQGYFAVSESERAPSKIKVCGVSVCSCVWLFVWLVGSLFGCLLVCVVCKCMFINALETNLQLVCSPPCPHACCCAR